jgi:hypothetical protein
MFSLPLSLSQYFALSLLNKAKKQLENIFPLSSFIGRENVLCWRTTSRPLRLVISMKQQNHVIQNNQYKQQQQETIREIKRERDI